MFPLYDDDDDDDDDDDGINAAQDSLLHDYSSRYNWYIRYHRDPRCPEL